MAEVGGCQAVGGGGEKWGIVFLPPALNGKESVIMCFTAPTDLTPDAIAGLDDTPAVYKVFPPKSIRPKAIPRFLGNDEERVLFIGQSSRLKGRLNDFLGSMAGGNGPHVEGDLIYILNREIHDLNLQDVMFSYKVMPTQEAAENEEQSLIKRYVQRFGEVPPINSAIPNRNGPWPTDP